MGKQLPELTSDAEAEVFLEHDISDYLDPDVNPFVPVKFEFLPKDNNVNLRLPSPLLAAVKAQATQQGIPYQRFIRMALERSLTQP
ncbi:MAG: CopG family antitoxin [Bacteroidota bacterium]